jgi:hypothetical protein
MLDGAISRGAKPREQRRRTMLPARMRSQSGWSDACILNISSRGLLIYSNGLAQPGTFVEVRRGGQLVIARVVWRQNQRMGLCSPDPVHVEDIIRADSAAAATVSTAPDVPTERRRIPRDPERSRDHGRAAEFIAIVLIGGALAFAAMASMQETLARPLAAVDQAMRKH